MNLNRWGNMKRVFLITIGIVGIFSIIFTSAIIMSTPSSILTDSGWDTDYGGSSSSWDSGSDYGSSHDYNYSYDDDYSGRRTSSHTSSNKSDNINIVLCLFAIVIVVIVVEKIFSQSQKNNSNNDLYEHAMDDANEEIQKYFPNMTEKKLLDILYKKFLDIQYAWMNFDYEALEKLCTDELFNSYKTDLEVLKLKNGKNVMSNFNLSHYNINGITKENDIISIKMFLHVSFYDYVINTTNEEIIRGNKNGVVHNQYILTFVTKKADNIIKCPSCGSEISSGSSQCEYCHTIINNNYDDFVLSAKDKI